MAILVGIVVSVIGLCACIGTFFATKRVYETSESSNDKNINNQLIIMQERDNSHEFAQTVVLIIFGIVLAVIISIICIKFITNWCVRKLNNPQNVPLASVNVQRANQINEPN